MPENLNRRSFLMQAGSLSSVALSSMLFADPVSASSPRSALLHHPPKAKRVVQLFMSGAASQCDTFDYKPLLEKRHGQKWDIKEKVELFQSKPGNVKKSPWPWKTCGQSEKKLNACVAPLGDVVDEIAFVHNMAAKSNVHGPATFMQSTGFTLPGFPSAGAWVSYGLGNVSDDLPTFVVLPDPRGFAPNGP